jgi:hypothetical protein
VACGAGDGWCIVSCYGLATPSRGGMCGVPLALVLSTLYPPCEQLLIDMGTDAWASIIVGVCCGHSTLVVVVLGRRSYVGVSDVAGVGWGLLGGLYSPPQIPGGILRIPQDSQESQE